MAITISDVNIIDNSKEVLKAAKEQILAGLTACGMAAEGYAKANITQQQAVDTGQLRNSITFQVQDSENAVYIGSNVEYAPYVELGTGVYYDGGGRQTPWTYQDGNGDWHISHGMRARPYLKPAITDHANEYSTLLKDALKG